MTQKYLDPEFVGRRSANQGWHLDKKVPLSLIFAMLVQAGMVIVAVADIKKDVEVLKADVVVLHQRDNRLDADSKEQVRLLQDHLVRIDAKLDRLIERRP
jgi:hypothetical protein